MGTIMSQITSFTIVYTTVYSGADQSKYQSSASLAFVWGIHRGPVNSPHKWPVTRKMFPFDDVIMGYLLSSLLQTPLKYGSQYNNTFEKVVYKMSDISLMDQRFRRYSRKLILKYCLKNVGHMFGQAWVTWVNKRIGPEIFPLIVKPLTRL